MPLDLHVLSLPLAFILSQDQTLHCIIISKYLTDIYLIIFFNWRFSLLRSINFSVYLRYLGSLFSKINFPSNAPLSLASFPRRLGLQKYYLFHYPPNVFTIFLILPLLTRCFSLWKILTISFLFRCFYGFSRSFYVFIGRFREFRNVDFALFCSFLKALLCYCG